MAISVFAPIIALLLIAGPAPVLGQTYPDHPIRVIVANPPGGLGDLFGRTFGDFVKGQTGQPVVIENRTGASGNIAWEATAHSTPDGYTIGLVNTGVIINKYMFKALRYDVFKDLVPVAPIGEAPQLFFVNSKLPAKTLKEFIAYAKSQNRPFSYGSAGAGSSPHLAGDQLARRTGINLVHVPYRGVAPAITDLRGGHIDSISVSIGPMWAAVASGEARPLFALTPKRLAYLPEVPTSAEVGIPGLHMSTWFALMAPHGTPKAVVERLNSLMHGMQADPVAQKRLSNSRIEPMVMTAEEFGRFMKEEAPKWERAVREAGLLGKG